MLNMFSTSHEKIEKLGNLKKGKVKGLEVYPVEKQLIKIMTKLANRPNLRNVKCQKPFE